MNQAIVKTEVLQNRTPTKNCGYKILLSQTIKHQSSKVLQWFGYYLVLVLYPATFCFPSNSQMCLIKISPQE